MLPLRLTLLSLPFNIRHQILKCLVLDSSHIKIKRRDLSLDEIKQGCDMAPGSRPAVYRYSLSPPFAGCLRTCHQLYNEISEIVKSCSRFLRVDNLWMFTTLPLFVLNNPIYEKHVKTLIIRTSEKTTGEADDLRMEAPMEGYMARVQREQLQEKLAPKMIGHRAAVEGERVVEAGRVLLFVVHEVTIG